MSFLQLFLWTFLLCFWVRFCRLVWVGGLAYLVLPFLTYTDWTGSSFDITFFIIISFRISQFRSYLSLLFPFRMEFFFFSISNFIGQLRIATQIDISFYIYFCTLLAGDMFCRHWYLSYIYYQIKFARVCS